MSQTIAILGAGRVGGQVGLNLFQQGYRVFAVRRHLAPSCLIDLGFDGHRLTGSASSIRQLTQAGADLVIIALAPSERTPLAYRACYLQAPQSFLGQWSAKALSRVRQILFVSSTAVFAEGEVTDTSPPNPATWNGQILRQAEQQLASRWRTVIINAAGIYAPLRWRLLEQLQTLDGARRLWHKLANQIHEADLVDFITYLNQLSLNGQSLASRYIACDGQTTRYAQLINHLAQQDSGFLRIAEQLNSDSSEYNQTQKHCYNQAMQACGFRLGHTNRFESYDKLVRSWRQWQQLTDFQRQVLKQTFLIPYGQTLSYKKLADAIGSKAYRAVGTALKKNPLAPYIPCHRVIKSDGSVGGFEGHIEGPSIAKKHQLLMCEKAIISS